MDKKNVKNFKTFNIATFNVRGMANDYKKEQLIRDMTTYNVDVCCLQETKLAQGINKDIKDHKIIAFESKQIEYGNGFVINKKWKDFIYKFWKVSDRVCVLQLRSKESTYEVKERRELGMTLKSSKKHLINIINVYAPTTQRLKKHQNELNKMYRDLEKLCKEFEKISTSVTIIAGDLNAKIGKRETYEKSIGSWSRGQRNRSGSKLIEFCEMHKKIISNSCFKHRAKNITTWSQQRTNKDTKIVTNIFNQIDYIIVDQSQKQCLRNSRSYSGTETTSDHRIVITRMEIHWPRLYKQQTNMEGNEKKIDIQKLVRSKEIQEKYKDSIRNKLDQHQGKEYSNNQKWENLKDIMKTSAEETVGYVKRLRKDEMEDQQIEEMSKKQKKLRVEKENSKDTSKVKILKKERKSILKKITTRMKNLREEKIKNIINEVESAKDDTRMFKAVKELYLKRKKINFVQDEEGKNRCQPQEIYNIIEKHFKEHFSKDGEEEVPKFITEPKELRKPVMTEEITNALWQMGNNRKPGKDTVNVEFMKYGPKELHEEVSEIINNIFIENDAEVKLGTGVLLPIPKPNKKEGPTKHLRPITLLEVIRKVLSKIFMNRSEEKINSYLSQSQSAYRKKRSTTDAVWAHRWIAAKAQEQEITIYITGIDMTSAFDTIHRKKIIEIAKTILDEDEIRMLHLLLSDTTLEVYVDEATTKPFNSNIGSPQGDSISGPLFNIYMQNSITQVKKSVQEEPIDVREINKEWVEKVKSNLPSEIIYADDCDFITEMEKKKDLVYEKSYNILRDENLIVNDDKTEHTIIRREKKREEENWRNTIKLGSMLGDKKDIQRRKELSNTAMRNNENIWKRKWKVKLSTRIKLYNTLVKPILLYNCGTWGLSKTDQNKLNSFHRRQLRRILGVKWPHRISNIKLYDKTNSVPLSKTISERRWKLLGHIMRLPKDCPARKAMSYFFEVRSAKKFRGRKRTTIITTLNDDIKRTKEKYSKFPVVPLVSLVSLQNIWTKAKNRTLWKSIVKQVTESAYS